MPASKLRLRSGLSDGLSVNAISKPSGGRMPVPADARSFVASGVAGPRYQATASLGLAETSLSAGKGGRGLNGSDTPGSASRVMSSTRSPPVTNTRLAGAHLASPK